MAALLRKTTLRPHGQAYRWLRQHRDELRDLWHATRPTWSERAATMTAMGFLDRNGQPYSAGALRKLWVRIEAEPMQRPAAPATRVPAAEAPAAIATTQSERLRPTFAAASLRGDVPADNGLGRPRLPRPME